MRRIWLSLIVLPWLLAFSYTGLAVLTTADGTSSALQAMLFAVFAALFAYIPMGLVAAPALLVGLRYGRVNVFTCVLIGVFTGLVVLLCFGAGQLFDERLRLGFRIAQLLSGYPLMIFGALAGGLFWLLGVWGNPICMGEREVAVDSGVSFGPPQ